MAARRHAPLLLCRLISALKFSPFLTGLQPIGGLSLAVVARGLTAFSLLLDDIGGR